MSLEYCPQCNLEMAEIYNRDEIAYASLQDKLPKYLVDAIRDYVNRHGKGKQFFICNACGFVEEV
ncbi:MAG: hypothetical protein WCR55_13705 [Lentisphaerota bacterium]